MKKLNPIMIAIPVLLAGGGLFLLKNKNKKVAKSQITVRQQSISQGSLFRNVFSKPAEMLSRFRVSSRYGVSISGSKI